VKGIDTNVLVRYVMQDDERQSALATKLFEGLTIQEPGFIALVSLVEFSWVLSSCFDLKRDDIADAVEQILRTKQLVVESAETVWKAVRGFRSSAADLADCIIERTAAAAGCSLTFTFDRDAARTAGMTLLK